MNPSQLIVQDHYNARWGGKLLCWTGIGCGVAATALETTAILTHAVWLAFAASCSLVGFPVAALLISTSLIAVGALIICKNRSVQRTLKNGAFCEIELKEKPWIATKVGLMVDPIEKDGELDNVDRGELPDVTYSRPRFFEWIQSLFCRGVKLLEDE